MRDLKQRSFISFGPMCLRIIMAGLILSEDKKHVFSGHGHNNGKPTCLKLTTGKVVWGGHKLRGPGDRSAAITYADGHLIFRYENGTVGIIEANTEKYNLKGLLKPEFQQKESWAHPVVCNRMLYLREQDKLMCYDMRKEQ